jgi:hypothetical protein
VGNHYKLWNRDDAIAIGTSFKRGLRDQPDQPSGDECAVSLPVGVSNAFTASGVVGFDQILDESQRGRLGRELCRTESSPDRLSNVMAIAGAYDHSLALRNNGTVAAWGDNSFGQINVPAGLTNLLAVAGGQYYSMALRNNGTVAAWGANIFPGQTNVPAD